jgi:plasmid stabilization system protein ParE
MRQFVRLEWSIFALTDRDAIFDYIEADSPQAAIAVDNRIRAQVESLAEFPESGRPGPSRERGSWLFTARPISPLIVSLATPCGFCVHCTVPSSGPRICPKNRKSELKTRRGLRSRRSTELSRSRMQRLELESSARPAPGSLTSSTLP